MKFYSIKKLIHGANVNPIYSGKTLIAIPDKYLGKGDIHATYCGRHMTIKKDSEPLTFRIFDDKFGRDTTYRLMYFEWNPELPKKFEYQITNNWLPVLKKIRTEVWG